MWDRCIFEELNNVKKKLYSAGGVDKIEKQHRNGKLTARERIDILLDKGTFVEVETLREARPDKVGEDVKIYPGDGVITGFGKIDGRLVFVSSEDFTVNGGTLGETHSKKICHIQDLAFEARAPFISINDSGGARIEEGINSLAGYSGIFFRNTRASGVIPQIAVILGPCAGGACYSPAICDYIFMTKETSKMFITGPVVVKTSVFEDISADDLGGADVHFTKSGVSHFVYSNDKECLMGVKKLLSYLPLNNEENPPKQKTIQCDNCKAIQEIVPDNYSIGYDVLNVIKTFVDKDTFFEVQREFGKTVVVGFSRINGDVVGIVASQPKESAGVLDINSSDKAARFIRFCDCFNIPLVTLVDVPGYMPGSSQEHNGIIRHGAKVLYAYSEATVPKIGIIMRKAFGGAYIAMNSKYMGADYVFAWPIARMAVMGSEGAVDIMYAKRLKDDINKEETRKNLISEYEKKYLNPYIAVANGYIDDIIDPKETKNVIVSALDALKTKRSENPWKKHGNIPL